MWVSTITVIAVILRVSHGSYLNGNFDKVNSHINLANTILDVLERDDNGISPRCKKHSLAYGKSLLNGEIWALKLFDASSKIPSGLMDGNFVDLGFFDECVIAERNTTLSTKSEKFFGQYCIGTLPISIDEIQKTSQNQFPNELNFDTFRPAPRVATPDLKMGLQFGICWPDSCSATEIQKIFNDSLVFYEELCQTKADQPKLDDGGIATLSFLGVILWIMLVSSAYDIVLHYMGKNPLHPILIAFSVLTNGKKIITTSNAPNQISCLHGIRVISTMWVILGHRYIMQATFPMRNYLYIEEWMNNRANMFIINAPLSVDTFFLMSGLVVAYTYMSAVSKGVKFNIFLYYIHRYLRLTPVIAVIIAIHITLLKHLGSGPVYPSTVNPQLVDGCDRYWWKTLLYVQNYGNQDGICIPQSWYLCVDTQLFLLSPIILLPLKRWPKATLLATGFLTLCSMITSFLIGWFFELNMSIAGNTEENTATYMKWYYFATQTRAGPWLIGIVLGYYIFQVKQRKVRVVLNKSLVLIVWAASLGVLSSCLFTGNNLIFGDYDRAGNSIYMALARPAWAFALSWIILLCVIGYGGPVNWFLSLPIFQMLSKLTYSMYLLHLQIIIIITAQMRTPPVFSNGKMMYAFWGDFAFTLVVSAMFTLAFESPMITIEQIIFGKTKKKEVKPTVPNSAQQVEKSGEIA